MTVPHRKTKRQNKSPYQIQVLDRALAVLQVLSQEGPDLTLAQVSSLLHLHKSTAHRLIMVLEGHKLIERNSKTGTYRLGMKLFELGTRAVSQLDLRERARPILERLVREHFGDRSDPQASLPLWHSIHATPPRSSLVSGGWACSATMTSSPARPRGVVWWMDFQHPAFHA